MDLFISIEHFPVKPDFCFPIRPLHLYVHTVPSTSLETETLIFHVSLACLSLFLFFSQGGISTKDEMCLDFLFYYPRIPGFKDCASTSYEPTHRFIDKYLYVPPSLKHTDKMFLYYFFGNNDWHIPILFNPFAPRVEPWTIHVFPPFDSMDRTLKV